MGFTIEVGAMDQLHFLIRSLPEPAQEAMWPLSNHFGELERLAWAAKALAQAAKRPESSLDIIRDALDRVDDSLGRLGLI